MKLIFCLQINIKVFYKMIVYITLGMRCQACPKYPKQQVYNIFAINMSRKMWRTKFIFCLLINIEGFLKVMVYGVCVWPGMPILPKEKSEWCSWFLYADKHEHLHQIDTMILMEIVKYSQSSQNSKFAMSLQHLKKEVRDETYFLHADKHQSFLQVDFNTSGIKDFYKMILSLLVDMI